MDRNQPKAATEAPAGLDGRSGRPRPAYTDRMTVCNGITSHWPYVLHDFDNTVAKLTGNGYSAVPNSNE
jgi:hypothetical protein